METVGIIGAGQMGAGIAQVAAASGYTVVLADREPAIAEKARDSIAKRFARLFFESGDIVLCAFVSPYAADRDAVRRLFPEARFIEVHVACDPDVLRARDVARAIAFELDR